MLERLAVTPAQFRRVAYVTLGALTTFAGTPGEEASAQPLL